MRDAIFRRQIKMGTMSERGLDDGGQPRKSGAWSSQVAHGDILHIKSVIQRLSAQDLNESRLPPAYWRKRLQEIMQSHQLSKSQFDEIDRLLATLKE
ncbi:hypothetical protein M3I54_36310 [Paraburkholderia sp. CNPSo 3274]|uniref:hypothetical protein n=1 Tax=Paraburkholderia sp. CNPSo 3274 TaxID=2940932 RepID=UPI0020B7F41E|nr:hypothetical protein [Paraburkholderia sp. CNPSo 3274]MCP3712345.1 hypothetical protein [Paraburkholderia sp. CNPSo 3274]